MAEILTKDLALDRFRQSCDSRLRALLGYCKFNLVGNCLILKSTPTVEMRLIKSHLYTLARKLEEHLPVSHLYIHPHLFTLSHILEQAETRWPRRGIDLVARYRREALKGDQLQTLLKAEATPYPVTILSRVDYRILYANSRVAGYGSDPNAMIGQLAAKYCCSKKQCNSLKTDLESHDGKISDYELCICSENSQRFWMAASFEPAIFNGVSSVISICRPK